VTTCASHLAGAAPDAKGPSKVLEVVAKAVARAAGIPTAAEQAEQLQQQQQQPQVSPSQPHMSAATPPGGAGAGGGVASGEQLQSGGRMQFPEGAVPSQGGQWSSSIPLRGYRR
jgi:hypothetical protein